MESFLLFCNTALMILVVVLTLLDQRRRPGSPKISPFRIGDQLLTRDEVQANEAKPEKRRRVQAR